MKGIVMHWTGGTHKVSSLDKKHYHMIYAGDGTRVAGTHTIADNENTADGVYAAHTLHMNTNFISQAIACMGGKDVKPKPINYGKWPPTKAQVYQMCKDAARLCQLYGIKIVPELVMTHAEVEKNTGIKQRGKWDINFLPWLSKSGNTYVGNYLRKRIKMELKLLNNPTTTTPVVVQETTPELVTHEAPRTGWSAIFAATLTSIGWALYTFWQKIQTLIEGILR